MKEFNPTNLPSPLPEKYGFRTRFFDLPGLRVHAAEAGPADGPLALLLHGFPGFWYCWLRQMPALAEAGFHVLAPDQRGYNLTEKQGPYSLDTLAADMAGLVTAAGCQKAFVAGHDWGAAVAWTLAFTHPERVEKLAVLNVPHPYVMVQGLRGGNVRQLLKSWYIFFFQIPRLPEALLSRNDFTGLRRLLRGSGLPDTFSAADLDTYTTAWEQPGALRASIGWYRAMAKLSLSPRSRSLDRRVTRPAMILWGDQDVALEASLGERSLQWCDDGRIVHYPGASHWVQLDAAEQVNRQLVQFFA
jgi:epoxide hydrolase 4